MSVNKMHRMILVGTAVILALVLALSPGRLAAPLSQQAGLAWLPLLLPLLVLSLGANLRRPAREDIANLTASWSGILRWAILLPLFVPSFPATLTALAGGLFWAWLLPIASCSSVFSTMDEPWLEQLLHPETTHPAPFALATITATCSRLAGLNFYPVIVGLALAAGAGRPLWATGVAAIAAEVYRTYFDSGVYCNLKVAPGSWYLLWLGLPVICWFCKVGWGHLADSHQLSFDFGDKPGKRRFSVLAALLIILLLACPGRDIGYFLAVSGIAMFYTVLARSTIGLLLFPIWSLLQLVPVQTWSSFAVPFLAGVIAAILAGQIWTWRRSSCAVRPSLIWSATITLLAFGMLRFAGADLTLGLAGFPSASGDWLAWLSAVEFSPVLWFFFVVSTSLGILSEQKIYIYLAWGLFLPVDWGVSLTVGSGLAFIFAKQTGRVRTAGKGLIVGDLMASLLLLLS